MNRGAAALMLALAACGGDGPIDPGADAGLADAGVDGAAGPITVTVYGFSDFEQPRGPEPGVPVIFVGPDGAELAAITDDAGQVHATIGPGTTVFALRQRTGWQLNIYAGIDPGVELIIGAPPAPFSNPRFLGSIIVRMPLLDGAGTYFVTGSCLVDNGSIGPELLVSVRACANVEHATILVSAFGDQSELLAYGVVHDVDLRAAIAAAAPDLPLIEVPALVPAAIATTTLTSVPPEVSGIVVAHRHRDRDVGLAARSNRLDPDGAVLAVALPIAAFADRSEVQTLLFGAGSVGQVWNLRRVDGPALDTRVDLGATMQPFMTVPSVSLASRTAAWTLVGGSGRRPDLIAIRGGYDVELGRVDFAIFGPGDRTHVTWPAFPVGLAAVAPRGGTQAWITEFYGIDLVGRGFRDVVPTADGEARSMLGRDDVYRDADDLWVTGRTSF